MDLAQPRCAWAQPRALRVETTLNSMRQLKAPCQREDEKIV